MSTSPRKTGLVNRSLSNWQPLAFMASLTKPLGRDSLKGKRLLGAVAALAIAGCSTAEIPSTVASDNVDAEEKKVLTTFTILADIAQNVAGDALTVESIVRPGAEIHGYEPVPSDIAKAQRADLLLSNGMGLERWFEQFLGSVKDVPTVVVTEGITPIPIAEGPYADKPNPHAWMSPQNALIYVENIRQAFVELDPENAALYNENAAAYSEQLKAIDSALREDLNDVPESQRYLVSCEGAFSYLARDYGLSEIYVWPINAEQQSTPKQLKAVIDKVQQNDVPTIFCESTVSAEAQKEVAQTTGAEFGGSLYVDSLSNEGGPVPTYLDLLAYDAQLISDGLLERTP
ncbi:MAG: metal ABC transporter substrate-binding protein [Cyanobacteria bacterium J06623_4]